METRSASDRARRLGPILAGVALLLAVAGGAFYGGIRFQSARQQNLRTQFLSERGAAPGNDGAMPFGGSSAFLDGRLAAGEGPGDLETVTGTVKSIEGGYLLISTAVDVTTVLLTDSTAIQQLVAVDPTTLQPGQRVSVLGSRDTSGVVAAASIQILGEVPPQ